MILDDGQHFVRYCKPTTVQEGKILTTAFQLRKGETGLSGDHFEFFSANHYSGIIQALITRNFTPKPEGVLAKLNCGETSTLIKNLCNSKTCFERSEKSSHTEFFGLTDSDECVYERMLALIKEQRSVEDALGE